MNIIGEGADGLVYALRDQEIAIKHFKGEYWFHRETLMNSILPISQYVVRFTEVDLKAKTASMPLYTMNLATYIGDPKYYAQRNTLQGTEERMNIIQDIFEGLNVIHSVGLVHSDLSQGNILLHHDAKRFRAVISDFGSATVTKIVNENITTHCIASPDRIVTCAHDFYAVGRLIYSMWKPSIILDGGTHEIKDFDLMPEAFRHLAMGLLNSDPIKRLEIVSKYIQVSATRCASPEASGNLPDSKHIEYIRKLSLDNKHLLWGDSENISNATEALLRTQKHLQKYHMEENFMCLLAWIHVNLMVANVSFLYEEALEDLNMKTIDSLESVRTYIHILIREKQEIVKLFVKDYLDVVSKKRKGCTS